MTEHDFYMLKRTGFSHDEYMEMIRHEQATTGYSETLARLKADPELAAAMLKEEDRRVKEIDQRYFNVALALFLMFGVFYLSKLF